MLCNRCDGAGGVLGRNRHRAGTAKVRGPKWGGTKGDAKSRNFWCMFDVLKFLCGETGSQMVARWRFCP